MCPHGQLMFITPFLQGKSSCSNWRQRRSFSHWLVCILFRHSVQRIFSCFLGQQHNHVSVPFFEQYLNVSFVIFISNKSDHLLFRLLSHMNDPTLDSDVARDYILYLCPVGQLQQHLIEFWKKSFETSGWNRAHNYFPHITLCSFFKVCHVIVSVILYFHACPHYEFVMMQTSILTRCKSLSIGNLLEFKTRHIYWHVVLKIKVTDCNPQVCCVLF